VIIGWKDHRTGSPVPTITATTEQSAYPAQALLRPRLSDPWRGGVGVTAATLTVDLGAARTVGAAVLHGTRLSSAATISLEGSASSVFAGVPVYASGIRSAFPGSPARLLSPGHHVRGRDVLVTLPAPVSARYWRWVISDAGAAGAGWLEAALATFWETYTVPNSPRVFAPSSALTEGTRETVRTLPFEWEFETAAERAVLEGLLTGAHRLRRMLWVLTTETDDVDGDLVYGTSSVNPVQVAAVPAWNGRWYALSGEVLEVID
jgi:hypothetical protein